MKQLFLIAILMFSLNSLAQKNETMTNQDIVIKFLNGFNNPTQIQASLDLLAEDYKFKNPMIQLNSKTEFIALAKEIGAVITGIEIINIAESNNWVGVLYEFKSTVKGLESNTATEWFKIKDGIIKESNLIYDASEWRKFYARIAN